MEINNQEIAWSTTLERYFKDIGEKSYCYGYLHKKSEAVFAKKSMKIDLPVIVLSTVAGTLSIGSTSIFPEDYESQGTTCIGALSLFVGVLNTVGTYFEFGKRAENHRLSYIQYSKLYRFIDIELSLPRIERMRPKDLLKVVNDTYERLQEVSPIVPQKVLKTFTKKFKNYDVAKPSEANGLESISIYVPDEIDKEETIKASSSEGSLPKSDTMEGFLSEEKTSIV